MKTKKLSFFGILVLLLGVFNSCIFLGPSIKGDGNVVEKERTLGDFDEIKVTTGMNVWITQGDQTKVVVVADENLHDVILTEVSGKTLKVYTDSRIRWAKEKKVLITIDNLSKINSSAGSNVHSNGLLNFEDLEISTSSGSNANLEVFSKNLSVSASSGANAKLKGNAYKLELDASSGANIIAGGLEAAICEAEASSGANVHITVLNEIEAHASSGGNVIYYGNPEKVDTKTSSGGNVTRKH